MGTITGAAVGKEALSPLFFAPTIRGEGLRESWRSTPGARAVEATAGEGEPDNAGTGDGTATGTGEPAAATRGETAGPSGGEATGAAVIVAGAEGTMADDECGSTEDTAGGMAGGLWMSGVDAQEAIRFTDSRGCKGCPGARTGDA